MWAEVKRASSDHLDSGSRGRRPTARPSPAAARTAGAASSGSFYGLPVVVLLLLLVAPLLLMAALSFRDNICGPILQPWTPTLVQLQRTLPTHPAILRLLGLSAVMAGHRRAGDNRAGLPARLLPALSGRRAGGRCT